LIRTGELHMPPRDHGRGGTRKGKSRNAMR
jgi:hypothetical protein